MYEKGKGVPKDYAVAAGWYRKAAEQGNSQAQAFLGDYYARGQGVTQDYAAAAKWYRKAAEKGVPQAQNNLGVMYAKGLGVPNDNVLAHMWYNLAGSKFPDGEKRETAKKNRDDIAVKMTPAQIAEAQRLAREWKPKKGR